jgi:hypothetical protein
LSFPREVSYIPRTIRGSELIREARLMIEAPTTEKAGEIIKGNKDVIEKYCNVKISDKVELKEH